MAKTKKTFDRELMYKKIMPTNLKKDEDEQNPANETAVIAAEKNSSETITLYNITEKMVYNKLDATLNKMSCCKCERCKEDIVAIALNNLKPKYVVSSKDDIKEKLHEFDDMGREVTTEIIKAVLIVRKNPRH